MSQTQPQSSENAQQNALPAIATTATATKQKKSLFSPRASRAKKEKAALLEAKLAVLSTEFQDFVNTLEQELATVKNEWRVECEKNAALQERVAELAQQLAESRARTDAANHENAVLKQERDMHADHQADAALQLFVRGMV